MNDDSIKVTIIWTANKREDSDTQEQTFPPGKVIQSFRAGILLNSVCSLNKQRLLSDQTLDFYGQSVGKRCAGVCVCGRRDGGPTVGVHSHCEVISHGLGLPQLVGVAVVHHVVAARR